jgi:outer membrane protein TolC
LLTVPCSAQLSFTSAIDLALRKSPRVKSAENDVQKAQSQLAVMRDIYIPSVVAGAGIGETHGITLSVPTIFNINAQSLVYSAQQRDYIRASRFDLKASGYALDEARAETEEDAAISWLTLDNSQRVMDALTEQYEFATKLVVVIQDRADAKLESELELLKARRGAAQIKLQQLQAQDDIEAARAHLARLTSLSPDQLAIAPESIPTPPSQPVATAEFVATMPLSPGILAVEANTEAKEQRARGDASYTWRPTINFAAQYGRISPINDVSSFYNLQGNYNTANFGITIQFPVLDKVRKAAAQESLLDASRATIDLENLRLDEGEGRRKLQRSIPELAAKAALADLDLAIEQNELQSITVQLQASSGGPPLTPKEELNARMQERQRYLDCLNAKLQLLKAQISLLRQSGELEAWIRSLDNSPAKEK